MPTEIRFVDKLPVEEPVLDEEVQQARKKLEELALTEYAKEGTFSTLKVCEAATEFEEYAWNHVVEDDVKK